MLTVGTGCIQQHKVKTQITGILSSAVVSPGGCQSLLRCRNSIAASGRFVPYQLSLTTGTTWHCMSLHFAIMLTPKLLFNPPWCNTGVPQDLWDICRLHIMALGAIYLKPSFWGTHNMIVCNRWHPSWQSSLHWAEGPGEGPATSCGHVVIKLHRGLGSRNHIDANQELVAVNISNYPLVTLLWLLATY